MTSVPVFHAGPAETPFSNAVRVSGFTYLSGQIPIDAEGRPHSGPIDLQTRAVLDSISASLQQLGLSMRNVFKVTVWLSDLSDFAAFNAAYRPYFELGNFPVRSLVRADLAFGVGVEIEVIAHDSLTPGT